MGSIRRTKTKRRTRDLDQIHRDLRSAHHLQQQLSLVPAEDRPGGGQFFCAPCHKFFEQAHNLAEHERGKRHKRRARMLKDEPYSQKEADAAAGLGCAAFYAALEEKRERERERVEKEERMEVERE